MKSVQSFENIVKAKILKEVAEGWVLGPFVEPLVLDLRISPLGIVPKKAVGEYHLIHQLSYPKSSSMNDGIPQDLCSMHYTSFNTAVCMVRNCGVGQSCQNPTLNPHFAFSLFTLQTLAC